MPDVFTLKRKTAVCFLFLLFRCSSSSWTLRGVCEPRKTQRVILAERLSQTWQATPQTIWCMAYCRIKPCVLVWAWHVLYVWGLGRWWNKPLTLRPTAPLPEPFVPFQSQRDIIKSICLCAKLCPRLLPMKNTHTHMHAHSGHPITRQRYEALLSGNGPQTQRLCRGSGCKQTDRAHHHRWHRQTATNSRFIFSQYKFKM